jgi:hypothetical protein
MPTFEQHCRESIWLFGQAFEEVHHYLDAYAGKPPYGMRHRKQKAPSGGD